MDGRGTIRAITDPFAVTAEALRKLAEGQDPEVRPFQDPSTTIGSMGEIFAPRESSPKPLMRVMVRPSRYSLFAGQVQDDAFRAVGVTAEQAIQQAFQVSGSRIIFESTLPDGVYDILVETGQRQDLRASLMSQAEDSMRALLAAVRAEEER